MARTEALNAGAPFFTGTGTDTPPTGGSSTEPGALGTNGADTIRLKIDIGSSTSVTVVLYMLELGLTGDVWVAGPSDVFTSDGVTDLAINGTPFVLPVVTVNDATVTALWILKRHVEPHSPSGA